MANFLKEINSVEVAPYWNVNLNYGRLWVYQIIVEVAPYWNVNVAVTIFGLMFVWVEVAPYWNVNTCFHISVLA